MDVILFFLLVDHNSRHVRVWHDDNAGGGDDADRDLRHWTHHSNCLNCLNLVTNNWHHAGDASENMIFIIFNVHIHFKHLFFPTLSTLQHTSTVIWFRSGRKICLFLGFLLFLILCVSSFFRWIVDITRVAPLFVMFTLKVSHICFKINLILNLFVLKQ